MHLCREKKVLADNTNWVLFHINVYLHDSVWKFLPSANIFHCITRNIRPPFVSPASQAIQSRDSAILGRQRKIQSSSNMATSLYQHASSNYKVEAGGHVYGLLVEVFDLFFADLL